MHALRSTYMLAAALLAVLLFAFAPLASAQKAEKKSFVFHGVVESVDAKAGRVTVANEKIEGWMEAMTMAYSVDKPEDLQKVKAGDKIEATVYEDDYKLYQIKVVGQK